RGWGGAGRGGWTGGGGGREGGGGWGGRARARWRRMRRRSRSLIPPQMPNFSPLARAYSRQSSRTTQPRHTSLASFVDAPRSGKKRSGSTPRQFAWRCQARSAPCTTMSTRSLTGTPLDGDSVSYTQRLTATYVTTLL